jgi:hypothetical protein
VKHFFTINEFHTFVDTGHQALETLERTPKLSAEWFKEAARQNAVV